VQVQQSAVLAIKHLLAVADQGAAAVLLPLAQPALLQALHKSDDDVRAAAAQALISVADAVKTQPGESQQAMAKQLWQMLPLLDDLSAATASAVQLLGILHQGSGEVHEVADSATTDSIAELQVLQRAYHHLACSMSWMHWT
jgi:hypothetical protein